jgi:hypothetical protein
VDGWSNIGSNQDAREPEQVTSVDVGLDLSAPDESELVEYRPERNAQREFLAERSGLNRAR